MELFVRTGVSGQAGQQRPPLAAGIAKHPSVANNSYVRIRAIGRPQRPAKPRSVFVIQP